MVNYQGFLLGVLLDDKSTGNCEPPHAISN